MLERHARGRQKPSEGREGEGDDQAAVAARWEGAQLRLKDNALDHFHPGPGLGCARWVTAMNDDWFQLYLRSHFAAPSILLVLVQVNRWGTEYAAAHIQGSNSRLKYWIWGAIWIWEAIQDWSLNIGKRFKIEAWIWAWGHYHQWSYKHTVRGFLDWSTGLTKKKMALTRARYSVTEELRFYYDGFSSE